MPPGPFLLSLHCLKFELLYVLACWAPTSGSVYSLSVSANSHLDNLRTVEFHHADSSPLTDHGYLASFRTQSAPWAVLEDVKTKKSMKAISLISRLLFLSHTAMSMATNLAQVGHTICLNILSAHTRPSLARLIANSQYPLIFKI